MRKRNKLFSLLSCLSLAACGTAHKPLQTVDHVDLQRFMGDWYVIANIPTFIERDAYNAVESYAMNDDGSIATTFRFNKGGYDGPQKTYHPTGYVIAGSGNAVWGMQFIWPVKADYRVIYLTDDYAQTVIGRNKRDFVWIMARTAQIPEADYQAILDLLLKHGYDTGKIQRVPHAFVRQGDAR